MTTVLETCGISPPPGSASDLSLPLCFFDIIWIHYHPIRRLLFYNHPCSEAEFSNTIVPNLKHSLSLTLKHFLPVAGNLLYPLDTDKSRPLIRYVSGDSTPLTVAVSGRNFDDLIGSHVKESDQFYDLLPPLPPVIDDGKYKIAPLVAMQATLFPGRGICVGMTNHHCLGDARSVAGFMSAWADINRHGGDEQYCCSSPPCIFDRSVMGYANGADEKYWSAKRKVAFTAPSSLPMPSDRVRAAFTLHLSDIKRLKNRVFSEIPGLVHVSSFVVTAAYAWSAVVKSAAADEVDEGRDEAFIFPADARGRPNALIDPPVPVNYFGNCIGGAMVRMERKKVAADGGFVAAAEAIADRIKNQVNCKDNFLKGWDDWMSERPNFAEMNTLGVSGSPKFDLLDADFGWGKGRRLEVVSMDREKYAMSLCNSSDSEGGLVVGLSLPRARMEAFATIFQDGLKL